MLPLYDKREGRKRGERIWLDREYEILSEEGRGGSSIVYRAFYEDSLKEKVEQKHIVLIKELYPITADGSVSRRENGFISWEDDKEKLFHAERFFQGNKVNLELLKEHPSLITGNLNSCAAYGTFYSVLPFYGGSTLEEYMKQEPVLSLRECSGIIKEILESLKPFHEKGLLHLDISPDNILLFHGQAVLIDFNCACSMDHLQENPYILGRKEGYTAPEIYIGEMGLIGFSADIYSICAVFFKLLTGKEPIDDLMEEPLSAAGIWKRLKREILAFQKSSETAVSKSVEILLKGLDLNPLGRYQNISQLEKEIDELLVRINHKGISRSVLWELGKRAWQQIPSGDQEYIPQEISVEGQENSSLKEFGGQLEEKRKILLRGTGGMGKTRLMKELARESMGRYDPKKPVYFYISLRGYQM